MSLPKNLSKGLYTADFNPSIEELNDFISNPNGRKKEVQQQVRKKMETVTEPKDLSQRDPKAPLTEEEAAEVDVYIENLRNRIAEERSRIASFRNQIDDVAQAGSEDEFSLVMNIKNRESLKKAVRIAFGKDVDRITYSMYKQAIELKRQIEQSETQGYVGNE